MQAAARVARRYSRALFALARQTGQVDAVQADLRGLDAWLASSADLRGFLMDYLIPREARRRALAALFENRVSPLAFRFLMFVESRKRSGVLGQICEAFTRQHEALLGIVRGQLCSAFALSPADTALLTGRIEARTPGRLELTAAVEPSLLGGFRLRPGDMVYDLSLAAQLRMLRKRMAGTTS